MLGYADLMLEEEVSLSEREKAVNAILRNGNHLLTLVNSILDLSKIEAGKLELEALECSPRDIVADVASLLKLKAYEKGVAFTVEFRYPIPELVSTDPTRLKQVLLNLIGNSIKFTSSGQIKVTVSWHQTSSKLLFEVCDSGPGMNTAQRERLFQAFGQADATISRRFGGTGLGLNISKQLIELMGGEIGVLSEEGYGSKFVFSIAATSLKMHDDLEPTLEAGIIEQCKALDIPKLLGKILVVDDVADNRDLFRHLIQKTEAEVILAENGKVGVEKALKTPVDLILLDMEMPVLDGLSAVKQLRQNLYRGAVVALTGNVNRETVERCVQAGFNDHMSKPIKREKFFELLARYLKHKTPNELSPIEPVLGEDFGDYIKIVLKFVDGLSEKNEILKRSIVSKDWHTVKTVAHRLIGAETFGYPDLTKVARKLERTVSDNLYHEATRGVEELGLLCERIIAGREKVVSLVPEQVLHA